VSDVAGDCLDDDNTVEGIVPAIGPNGEVYVTWVGHDKVYFDKSTDGGVSFGSDVIAANQPGGWVFDVPGLYRANGFPTIMCDVSDSPYRGRLYIVFSDQRNGTDDTDVFLLRSFDGGSTWYENELVYETGPNHQFFPWGTIDPVTGTIYVVYYDRRFTTGNATEVWLTYSEDGGFAWNDVEVSESDFTPNEAVFFGDYINVAAYGGKVRPIWMRMDGFDLSVWTAIVDIPTGADVSRPLASRGATLEQNYPNPFNPTTTIEFALASEGPVELGVFDAAGRRVKTLAAGALGAGPHQLEWDGHDAGGRAVGSGVYFYRLKTRDEVITRKMTLLK
jgi:hypothetical protein